MGDIWPPPPENQPEPPQPPPPEGGRDVLAAALIAAALLPVNAVLVWVVPGPHTAPPWWPYAFTAALGGLLMCWMYAFFGGLLHCRSRLPRLGLVIAAGAAGLCLLLYQAAPLLRLIYRPF